MKNWSDLELYKPNSYFSRENAKSFNNTRRLVRSAALVCQWLLFLILKQILISTGLIVNICYHLIFIAA